MSYEIVWTSSASESLDEAVRQIARDRPVTAFTFRLRVHERVDQLITLPYLGSLFEEDRSKTWREVYCDPYRIFYRVVESRKQIYVALCWHASRDEPTRADLLG